MSNVGMLQSESHVGMLLAESHVGMLQKTNIRSFHPRAGIRFQRRLMTHLMTHLPLVLILQRRRMAQQWLPVMCT